MADNARSFFSRVGKKAPSDPDADHKAAVARTRALEATAGAGPGLRTIPSVQGSGVQERIPGISAGDDLTAADETALTDGNATILTVDAASPVYLEAKDRLVLAMFDNGLIVVTKAERTRKALSELLARARHGGLTIAQIKTAEITALERLHAARAATRLTNKDLTRIQNILYGIINDAASVNASDIHIKREGDTAKLSRTIRGDFLYHHDMPGAEAEAIMMAAFSASMTGDKQYNPLKFRFTRLDSSKNFELPKMVQALRLQFSPTDNNGMELVGRLLYRDATTEIKDIDTLGYELPQIERLNIMRRQPFGIILISGPTGSGKSTTLKTALEKTNEDRGGRAKIVTIEDPPEYKIRGATQMPIESGASLDDKREAFTRAMSAMLRMAPHIGMVGEIRDENGSKLTFEMAKTGHLVWASVHANTALDVITRVQDMGVKNVDLNDPMMMKGLIAQRLIKAVCQHCAWSYRDLVDGRVHSTNPKDAIPAWLSEWYEGPMVAAWTGNMRIAKDGGCPHCQDTSGNSSGHSGRKVVAETIIPTRPMLTAMTGGRADEARAEWFADDKSVSMLEHGLIRVLRGESDPRDLTYAGDVTQEIDTKRIARLAGRFGVGDGR